MKVTWEEGDIKCGRRYSREHIKEVWIIGYIGGSSSGKSLVSISMLDGLVTEPKTAEEMAAMLTDQNYLPIELPPAKETK